MLTRKQKIKKNKKSLKKRQICKKSCITGGLRNPPVVDNVNIDDVAIDADTAVANAVADAALADAAAIAADTAAATAAIDAAVTAESLIINFIHIPKNGGTTVESYIEDHEMEHRMRYHGHSVPDINNIENQMIIIRSPYKRFCSAVQYAKSDLIRDGVEEHPLFELTPDIFCRYWISANQKIIVNDLSINSRDELLSNDIFEPNEITVLSEILNGGTHTVGSERLYYKWTYTEQSKWINEKKITHTVALSDVDDYFSDHFGASPGRDNPTPSDYRLSLESIQFLDKIYKKDFDFIKRKYWCLHRQIQNELETVHRV